MTLQAASDAKLASELNVSDSDISSTQLMTEINNLITAASASGLFNIKVKMESVTNGDQTVDYNNAGSQKLDHVVSTLEINGYRVREVTRGNTAELNIGWDYE